MNGSALARPQMPNDELHLPEKPNAQESAESDSDADHTSLQPYAPTLSEKIRHPSSLHFIEKWIFMTNIKLQFW